VTKGKYCRYCKQTSHITTNYAFLFPDKALKNWKNKAKKDEDKDLPKDKSPKEIRDDNIDVLYSKMLDESLEGYNIIDMDFNIKEIDNIQVNISLYNPNNNNITNNNAKYVNNLNINNKSKFALDIAATKYIICNKAFFTDFKDCNKVVNWGEAKSIYIKGIKNVYIKFKNFNKSFLLKNCLYMPELGINLIS
jgi:hypothetical protein